LPNSAEQIYQYLCGQKEVQTNNNTFPQEYPQIDFDDQRVKTSFVILKFLTFLEI
jgi:hypothetical protein